MKKELEHDYLVHKKNSQETPVFHRIKFEETSIFLTQASYSKVTTGKSKQGHYRVFSWTDFRAKGFLGFELGQKSPALGDARLIGSFKPEGDDLTEVKYHSFSGKAYFESALRELDNQGSSSSSTVTKVNRSPKNSPNSAILKVRQKRIDASNFMKMKEIIPTGAQGKAIYGEGNYIIDGAAGTGKSTTVLQKIKLLQLHSNVASDRICIIVKNQQVVHTFKGLLDSLNINGIKLYSQEGFVDSNFGKLSDVKPSTLLAINDAVQQYIADFESSTDLNKLTVRSVTEYQSPRILQGSSSFQQQYSMLLRSSDQFCLDKAGLAQSIGSMRKAHSEELSEFQRKFEANLLTKKRKSLRGRLKSVIGDVSLDLSDQATVREETFKYQNKLSVKLQRKSSENQEELDKKCTQLKYQKTLLIQELCSEANLQEIFINSFPIELVSCYINKFYPHLESFHTVIIDEAQDVAKNTIELIRLQSNNTILAGDELQTESASGVGLWKEVLFFDSVFSLKGKPNIFQLRHNFRQTYELGTVSYNYRQLMLNRSVEDIKQDYFDDQIGFLKPNLARINHSDDFNKLIEAKLAYVKDKFVGHFPLVIFYENDASLKRFQDLLGNKYNVCLDQANIVDKDIMLVSVHHIAGREFPVIIAPLTNCTPHSTVYIMLSRAKIDLTLALSSNNEVNPHIQKLIDENLISHQDQNSVH